MSGRGSNEGQYCSMGSGKTSPLSFITQYFSEDERIAIIEEMQYDPPAMNVIEEARSYDFAIVHASASRMDEEDAQALLDEGKSRDFLVQATDPGGTPVVMIDCSDADLEIVPMNLLDIHTQTRGHVLVDRFAAEQAAKEIAQSLHMPRVEQTRVEIEQHPVDIKRSL